MPRRIEHVRDAAIVGGLAGGGIAIARAWVTGERLTFRSFLGYTAVGTIAGIGGGMLPDILEPAISPDHRKLFHTPEAGVALAYGTAAALTNPGWALPVMTVVVPAVAGYESHLAADAQTPQGLPRLFRSKEDSRRITRPKSHRRINTADG